MTISPTHSFPLFVKSISQNSSVLWQNRTVILMAGIGIAILLILRKALSGQTCDLPPKSNEPPTPDFSTRIEELKRVHQQHILDLTEKHEKALRNACDNQTRTQEEKAQLEEKLLKLHQELEVLREQIKLAPKSSPPIPVQGFLLDESNNLERLKALLNTEEKKNQNLTSQLSLLSEQIAPIQKEAQEWKKKNELLLSRIMELEVLSSQTTITEGELQRELAQLRESSFNISLREATEYTELEELKRKLGVSNKKLIAYETLISHLQPLFEQILESIEEDLAQQIRGRLARFQKDISELVPSETPDPGEIDTS